MRMRNISTLIYQILFSVPFKKLFMVASCSISFIPYVDKNKLNISKIKIINCEIMYNEY
jgi:hypothetical protein